MSTFDFALRSLLEKARKEYEEERQRLATEVEAALARQREQVKQEEVRYVGQVAKQVSDLMIAAARRGEDSVILRWSGPHQKAQQAEAERLLSSFKIRRDYEYVQPYSGDKDSGEGAHDGYTISYLYVSLKDEKKGE